MANVLAIGIFRKRLLAVPCCGVREAALQRVRKSVHQFHKSCLRDSQRQEDCAETSKSQVPFGDQLGADFSGRASVKRFLHSQSSCHFSSASVTIIRRRENSRASRQRLLHHRSSGSDGRDDRHARRGQKRPRFGRLRRIKTLEKRPSLNHGQIPNRPKSSAYDRVGCLRASDGLRLSIGLGCGEACTSRTFCMSGSSEAFLRRRRRRQ